MSQSATLAPARSHFDYLPVGLFGSVMGLPGLSVAWRLALLCLGGPDWLALIPLGIGWLAVASFVVIAAGCAVKAITAAFATAGHSRSVRAKPSSVYSRGSWEA